MVMYYRDERGEIITKNQLYDEYKELKRYEEMSFTDYHSHRITACVIMLIVRADLRMSGRDSSS